MPSRSVTSRPLSRNRCTRFGAAAAFTTVTGTSSSSVAIDRESASFRTSMKKSGARIGPISRLFTSVRRSRRLSRSSFSITVLIVEIIPAPASRRSRRRMRPRGVADPNWARSVSGVPAATTRPWSTITMSSQSAATSCMTWLENRMQWPAARSRRTSARSARVAITSSPFVGSSSSRFRGACTSARASATLMRSPCE